VAKIPRTVFNSQLSLNVLVYWKNISIKIIILEIY